MGKQRRTRTNYHGTSSSNKDKRSTNTSALTDENNRNFSVPDDIIRDLKLDIEGINRNVQDDTLSVKSFKSLRNEFDGRISKKDKLKVRKQLLLRKIDAVKQLKKENKVRNKRKRVPLIGNTNPLHDALPSLESLVKAREQNTSSAKTTSKKSIQKASTRKAELLKGVKIFKKIFANKAFKKYPLQSISEHVKSVVDKSK